MKPIIHLDKNEIIGKILEGDNGQGNYVLAVAPDGSEAKVYWANRNRPWDDWPEGWLTTDIPAIYEGDPGQESDDALDMLTLLLSPEVMADARRRHDEEEIGWADLAEELIPDDWAEGKANYARDLAEEWLWALNGAPTGLDVQWGFAYTEEGVEPNEAPAEFDWEHRRELGTVEAAEYAGVSYSTMAQALRESRVPGRRIGPRTWLTTKSAIDKAIAEGKLRPRK